MVSVPEALSLGLQQHQSGRLNEAAAIYQKVLQSHPTHPDALHLLGVVFHQQEDLETACNYLMQALEYNQDSPAYYNSLGNVLCDLGHFDDALRIFRMGLGLAPDSFELNMNMANACTIAGAHEEALEGFKRLTTIKPDSDEVWIQLGNTLLTLLQFTEAQSAYEQALILNPQAQEPWVNLGVVHKKQGQWRQAIDCYQHALPLSSPQDPRTFDIYLNLGNAMKETGETTEALACYEQALALDGGSFEAHHNMSILLQMTGGLERALKHCQRTLQLAPDFTEAYTVMGAIHFEMGSFPEAIAAYEQAIGRNPNFGRAHYNLATIYQNMDAAPPEADATTIKHFSQSIELEPGFINAYFGLGNVLAKKGFFEEAREVFQQALALSPPPSLQTLRMETLCPVIPGSTEEMKAIRNTILQTIERYHQPEIIQQMRVDLETMAYTMAEPSFYLPYHGEGNRAIKSAYGDFFADLLKHHFPQLMPEQVNTASARKTGAPIRVGFFVTEHHENIFCKLMLGYLNLLPTDEFEIHVISAPKSQAYIRERLESGRIEALHFVELPKSLETTLQTIRQQALDVLFYDEVGTSFLNYILPFFRLAPVQCTSNGFPDTSGIPEMDYFLSSHWIETEANQNEYREKQILLEALPFYFYKPALPEFTKTRPDFNLPEQGTFYLCPQSLFKIHPDFDDLAGGILQQDPNGFLALLASPEPEWNQRLHQRIQQKYPEVASRIHFIPRQNYNDYLNLLGLADVILDTPHYSGSITTHEALALGTPIVTLTAPLFRGRVTIGCYEAMGMNDCITQSAADYIALAVKLGNEPVFRNQIRQKILATQSVLFENPHAIQGLSRFLKEATVKSIAMRVP